MYNLEDRIIYKQKSSVIELSEMAKNYNFDPSKLLGENGNTTVNINLITDNRILKFRLKNTRNLDRKSLNLLRKRDISSTIN